MIKYIFLFSCLVYIGCQNNETSSATPDATSATPTSQAPVMNAVSYPSITEEEMGELVQRTTLVDYVFYELPISMNLDNPGAINSALRQISNRPAQIYADCKPMGRVIFQDNGDIFKEADFYFTKPCFGFVFIKDNKKVSSNMMTEEGAKFFRGLLENAGVKIPE